MRISDWSSDVCSSDLPIPDHPSKPEFEAPKLWWNPSISPGGMMIYTGDLFPQYKGSAFIAALSGEALIRVELNGTSARPAEQDRKSVGQGKSGYVRVDLGGGRLIKKKIEEEQTDRHQKRKNN